MFAEMRITVNGLESPASFSVSESSRDLQGGSGTNGYGIRAVRSRHVDSGRAGMIPNRRIVSPDRRLIRTDDPW
jgi:hypothetical protein